MRLAELFPHERIDEPLAGREVTGVCCDSRLSLIHI